MEQNKGMVPSRTDDRCLIPELNNFQTDRHSLSVFLDTKLAKLLTVRKI